MNIQIRALEEKDFDSIKELLQEVFGISKSSVQGEMFHEVVAEVDSKAVGYLLLTKVMNPNRNQFYYLVDYVSVHPDYRGLQLGEKMLEYAEGYAKEQNASYLQLTCGHQRVAAHHVYEKCGFVKRDSDVFRKDIV